MKPLLPAFLLITALSITACKTTHTPPPLSPDKLIVNILIRAKDKNQWQQIQLINAWVNNRMSQSTDLAIWGKKDFWASPFESINAGAADCEDYALMKYFLLREAGVPASNLVLSHVSFKYESAPHMVLTYINKEDNGFYILDNIVKEIKPSFYREDLLFRYSFNENAVFTGRPPHFKSIEKSHPTQIKNWNSVIEKWTEEKGKLQK